MTEVVAASRSISELERLLVEERAAIAAADTVKVRELAERKNQEVAHLSTLLPAVRSQPAARALLAGQLDKLAGNARINQALLADAADLVADALGLREPGAGTYDARARVKLGTRPLTRRDIR